MIKIFKNKKGESLIEILVSIALLSLIAIVFLRAMTSLVSINKKNSGRLDGSYFAERLMEYLTEYEGMSMSNLRTKLTTSVDFSCTETENSDPYIFRVEDTQYPEMYAIIYIDHKKYRKQGNLSEVKVTVYATEDDKELSFMEDAIYWN
ncbi:MAG: prepilin-type N-terminal cleavage/methylation domain-containing protein [Lachnospiraceae bacterium]|nr:prepilin-type N-terminal cleavage/methylation domain-containing protein [Lachnospiraceae bacterium]